MSDAVRQPRRNEERLCPRAVQAPVGQAAEELLRLARIPEENPDPVFRVSAEHVLLYSNPAGERLCQMWGCRVGQKVPPAVREIVSAALADGAVAEHEVAFGARIYWLAVAPSVADRYVNLYARDITDHKQAQEALRQAERKFRAIFDNTSDGVFLHDLETGKFTMCNKSCAQMLGYTEQEFMKLGIADLHLEADLPFIYAQIEEFLKGGKPIRRDIRFKRKDGSIFFADVSPDLVLLEGKRYVAVVLKDITERKRMEEELRRHAEHLEELVTARTGELRESEEKFAKAFRSSPIAIAVTRLSDGRIIEVNEAMLKLLHFNRDEVMDHATPELDIWVDVADRAEYLQRVSRDGSARDREYRLRTREGETVTAQISGELMEVGGEPCVLTTLVDITERQRAEETLRQLSRKNEAALRVARMGHWEFDFTTEMFTFNDQYYTLHGTTAQAAGGYQMTAEEFARRYVHPDDAHLVQEHIQQAAAAHDPDFQVQVEARILCADGTVRWVTVWFRIEQDAQGRTTKLHGVNQDITERKQAEEALRVSEEHYRSLFDNMLNGFAYCRMLFEENRPVDFTYLGVNRAFEALTGLKNVTGKNVSEVIPGLRETNPELFETYGRVALTGRPEQFETYVESLGMWFLISVYSPRPEHFVAVFDVITERKRAEEALQRSERRERERAEELATFLDAAPTPVIIVHDPDGVHMTGNRAADELLRNPRGAEISLSAPPETRPRHFTAVKDGRELRTDELPAQRAARGEQIRDFEFNLVFHDGTIRHLLGYATPLRDDEGRPRGAVHVLVDITDRKQAEETLRELNATLEAKVARRTEDLRHMVDRLRQLTLELSQAEDRERKRIADILHEDVQQTLAAARFHLNLLGSENRTAQETRKIVAQVKQMLRDAIERSRSLSHELSPALYQVELLEILNWLARRMRQEHGLTVRVEAHGQVDSPSEPLKAFLYKVVQELLFNVIKYAGVSEAVVRARRVGRSIHLSVVDQGRGFDPQKLEGAAGFGLLGIRERVQLLGGRMKIRSTLGRGSRILIAVPDQGTSAVVLPAEYGRAQV